MFAPALQKLEKSLEKQSFSDMDPKVDKLAYVEFAEGEDDSKKADESSPWNLYFGESTTKYGRAIRLRSL